MISVPLSIVFTLIAFHYFSDFIFQSRERNTFTLSGTKHVVAHCIAYSLPFLWFGAQFFVAVLALHWVVDVFMSLLTKKLWDARKLYWHYIALGGDQWLHLSSLFIIYWLVPIDYVLKDLWWKLLG